jgi:hypothetical protein
MNHNMSDNMVASKMNINKNKITTMQNMKGM